MEVIRRQTADAAAASSTSPIDESASGVVGLCGPAIRLPPCTPVPILKPAVAALQSGHAFIAQH